jgi:dTDP-4-dehydrorhamnose 3,5-epimerase
MMSVPYAPGSARGARWDDPAFGVRWPDGLRIIAPKDLAWSDFPA